MGRRAVVRYVGKRRKPVGQCGRDALEGGRGQVLVEGKGEGAIGDVLTDRKVARGMAQRLPMVRLQVNRGEVRCAPDPGVLEGGHQFVAGLGGKVVAEADDVDKPAPRAVRGRGRQHEVVAERGQGVGILCRDRGPGVEGRAEPVELRTAHGG